MKMCQTHRRAGAVLWRCSDVLPSLPLTRYAVNTLLTVIITPTFSAMLISQVCGGVSFHLFLHLSLTMRTNSTIQTVRRVVPGTAAVDLKQCNGSRHNAFKKMD